jgi:hypothetical protein
MELGITKTDLIVEIDRVPSTCWKGITASGRRCYVLVHRIVVMENPISKEIEDALLAMIPPKEMPTIKA